MSEQPFGEGKLSYIQIPALDTMASARFYAEVFGWEDRGGNENHVGFTDATGDMIGAFVTGRVISRKPGVIPYLSVDDVDAALARIAASGGETVTPPFPEGDLTVATFRDPAGNVIGIWRMG
jgi:uncharacterized protein